MILTASTTKKKNILEYLSTALALNRWSLINNKTMFFIKFYERSVMNYSCRCRFGQYPSFYIRLKYHIVRDTFQKPRKFYFFDISRK